jgi:hypothetical protein
MKTSEMEQLEELMKLRRRGRWDFTTTVPRTIRKLAPLLQPHIQISYIVHQLLLVVQSAQGGVAAVMQDRGLDIR